MIDEIQNIESDADAAPQGMTLDDVNAELGQIEERMRSDRAGYFKDQAAQARHLALIEAKDHFGAADVADRDAGTDLDKVNAELAAIDKRRREDNAGYTKDNAMQARELELLGIKERVEKTAKETTQLRSVVDPITKDMPDREDFEASFDGAYGEMTPAEQRAVQVSLASPVEIARPAGDADVQRFASTPEGKACVDKWGAQAPRKVAVLQARFNRMAGNEKLTTWFNGLSSEQAQRVYEGLAG